MDTVRAKQTGTYDHSTKTWRLRAKRLQISIKQLSIRYGVQIEPSERASAPYWRRFLQDVADQHQQQQKANSPLQERIKSIEALLTRLSRENRPQSELDRLQQQLQQAVAVPVHDIDHADIPVMHPDAEKVAELLSLPQDEYHVRVLNSLIPTATATPQPNNSIKHEADIFVARHKAKKNKAWYSVKAAVELLLQATGDIALDAVTKHHWRAFYELVTKHPTWGKRSQANAINYMRAHGQRA